MGKEKKTLQERFLSGDKLSTTDEIIIKALQYLSDCDGTCSLCRMWYCESKRGKYVLDQEH